MNLHKYASPSTLHYAHSARIKADDVSDAGEFSGHAAVFGNVDKGGDMILPGAFTKTLKARGDKIRVLWNHSAADPIGRPTQMSEDNTGLFVRGQLNLDVQRGREARALLKAGDIDGLSIGFRVAKDGARFNEETEVFELSELELREFSIVTFPMNESAITSAIKTEGGNINTIRDFEQFLREYTNFSKQQVQSIAACGFKVGHRGDPGSTESDSRGDPGLDFSKALSAIRGATVPTFRRATIT